MPARDPFVPPAPARPFDRAIFVGGMPRSGTSLMRLILGLHPDVAMFPGELPLWREIAPAHASADLARPEARQRLVRHLAAHPRMHRAGIALDETALLAELGAEPAVTVGAVFARALREVARQAGKPCWGVKDPRSEFHADRIFAELPAARMVHMVRDPRDILASQRAAWGRRAQHIVSTIDDWRRSAALGRRGPVVHGNAYVAVRYEDLVTAPERVVGTVCAAIGLDYHAEMLEVAGQALWPARDPGESASVHRADSISPTSVGRYRADLHPGETRYVEHRARDELAAWGYETCGSSGGRGRARLYRCLGEEAAWRALRRLHVWPLLSRAVPSSAISRE